MQRLQRFRDRHAKLTHEINTAIVFENQNRSTKIGLKEIRKKPELLRNYEKKVEEHQSIEEERDKFLPLLTQFTVFLRYEFLERKKWLSYQRNGGGTLEALACAMGVGVTVLTGDSKLEPTLIHNSQNDQHFYLHHVGHKGTDNRQRLTHFNLLFES